MSISGLPAFNDNYIWVIVNEVKHTLTCVDPGDAEPVLSYARNNQLTLTNILITHHHADHTAGITALLHAFPNAKVYAPDDQRITPVHAAVRDGDIVRIDHYEFRVLSTPGHTSSHICYQEPTKGWLFCGDTLFSAGCGRVFDGTIEQLHNSISLLKHLPDNTQVYCGHEYTRQNLRFAATIEPENKSIKSCARHLEETDNPCSLPSTIKLEKQINPFMRTGKLQEFALTHGLNPHDSLAIFKRLRELKDSFN